MANSGEHGNFYVDPWQEYKMISAKLKKRFLRKPNVAEATREFANLATRLEEEQCSHYAGLCHLAVARCEHQVGNSAAETFNLKKAARLFMENEMDKKKMHAPSFGNSLNSAIHCYAHAIKAHSDQKQPHQAGNLSLELGVYLMEMDRCYEAVEHFDKASKFYRNQPFNEINALQWLCVAQVTNGERHAALKTLERLRNVVRAAYGDEKQNRPTGVWRKHLADAEIVEILLIFAIDPQKPQRLTEEQAAMRLRYASVTNDAAQTFVEADCFSYLQCFVLAIEDEDYKAADVCLTHLRPFLKAFMFDLAIEMVRRAKGAHIHE